jgi:hypothetical protein
MRSLTLLTTLMLGLCASSHAALYNVPGAPGDVNGGVIPDGNLSGWSQTLTVSGLTGTVGEIRINLTISGGYNGDLYAYLSHDGKLVPLLTRVGSTGAPGDFGYDTAGMNVTLADGGALNIHGVSSPVSGTTYKPDGQGLDLTTLQPNGPATYSTLASFNTTTLNGEWTLFFADVSGGATNTITGWSMDIDIVPEPINVALGVFGGLFLVGSLCRSERLQKLFAKPAPVID